MQPWRVSAGFTAAIAGATLILGVERLDDLGLYLHLVLAEYGVVVGAHLILALATVAAVICVAVRAAGLADLGRRVNLAERSVRRGEGAANSPTTDSSATPGASGSRTRPAEVGGRSGAALPQPSPGARILGRSGCMPHLPIGVRAPGPGAIDGGDQ